MNDRESSRGAADEVWPEFATEHTPELGQLSAIVSAPAFKFAAKLRPEHVKAIDDAVRASTVIVRKLKKMILASYG